MSFKLILYTHTHAHGFKESLKAAERDYKLERSKRRQCMIGLDASHTGSIHLPIFTLHQNSQKLETIGVICEGYTIHNIGVIYI